MTVFFIRDNFKITTCANKAGVGNKLVTIFARHLDSLIMTINFSLICQMHDFGAGQIRVPRQIILRRDLQKLRHGGLPAGTVFG